MKKLITAVLCIALVAGVLAGCGATNDMNTNNTTATTNTSVTDPTPTSEATTPSTIPDSGYMPDNRIPPEGGTWKSAGDTVGGHWVRKCHQRSHHRNKA